MSGTGSYFCETCVSHTGHFSLVEMLKCEKHSTQQLNMDLRIFGRRNEGKEEGGPITLLFSDLFKFSTLLLRYVRTENYV